MASKKPETIEMTYEVRYRCGECDTLLDDGERRCSDCNKFAARVLVLMDCPHCGEAITEGDFA